MELLSSVRLKVTVQFERCFQLMEHISVISWRNPINLYITEEPIKFSISLCNFYLLCSKKEKKERTPCFPNFVFPFRSSKSDVLRLMTLIISFLYLTLFAVQNRVSVFSKAALFVFYSQNPEIALLLSKAAVFYHDNFKTF